MSKFDRIMAVIWVIGFFGLGPFLIHEIFGWEEFFCSIVPLFVFCVIPLYVFFLPWILTKLFGSQTQNRTSENWGIGWSDSFGSGDYGDGGGGGYGGDCGGGDGGGDCGGGE